MSACEPSQVTKRIYGYVAKQSGWLVTMCDDKGLHAMMSACGAQVIVNTRGGVSQSYWKLNAAQFSDMQCHLDGLGYCDNQKSSKSQDVSSAYRIASGKSEVSVSVTPEVLTYTVKEIGNLIGDVIKKGISGDIWVQGELFDASKLEETRWFFGTLVDSAKPSASGKLEADHRLKMTIWGEHWSRIRQKILAHEIPGLASGTKIRVRGRIDYSSKFGQPQLKVEEIDPYFTEGEIYKQKRLILEKLQAMGISELNKQLPMPILPLRLAVFSSSDAAGYRDFITILRESGFPFRVTLFSVRVQGRELEPMFMSAFKQLESIGYEAFDLGLILRGGGSMLDLEGFNNLKLGEYVARCPLKFLIAIGHEKNKSVLDEIAEFGITPTDAGRLIVRRFEHLESLLQRASVEIQQRCQEYMQGQSNALRVLSSDLARCVTQARSRADLELAQETQKLQKAVMQIQNQAQQRLHRLESDLSHHVKQRIQTESGILAQYAINVTHHVSGIRAQACHDLELVKTDLRNIVQHHLQSERQKLNHQGLMIAERVRVQKTTAQDMLDRYSDTIKLLDPSDLYRRGFVTLRNAHGKTIRSIEETTAGDKLQIRLIDGQLGVTVDSCTPDKPHP